jgi:hypothetical protein
MKAARLMPSGSWFISNANTSRKGIGNNPSTLASATGQPMPTAVSGRIAFAKAHNPTR